MPPGIIFRNKETGADLNAISTRDEDRVIGAHQETMVKALAAGILGEVVIVPVNDITSEEVQRIKSESPAVANRA